MSKPALGTRSEWTSLLGSRFPGTGGGKARSRVVGSRMGADQAEITQVTMDALQGGHDSLTQGLRGLVGNGNSRRQATAAGKIRVIGVCVLGVEELSLNPGTWCSQALGGYTRPRVAIALSPSPVQSQAIFGRSRGMTSSNLVAGELTSGHIVLHQTEHRTRDSSGGSTGLSQQATDFPA